MRYALYGNDIDDTTNPLEAGLGWVVKPAKGDFIGRAAIERVRAAGPAAQAGRVRDDRARGRPHGYPVVKDGAPTGVVTSGSFGPSVDRYIAMAYVGSAHAAVGTELGRGDPRPGQARPRREDALPSAARQERLSDGERPRRPPVHARARVGQAGGQPRARRASPPSPRSSSATSSSSSCPKVGAQVRGACRPSASSSPSRPCPTSSRRSRARSSRSTPSWPRSRRSSTRSPTARAGCSW